MSSVPFEAGAHSTYTVFITKITLNNNGRYLHYTSIPSDLIRTNVTRFFRNSLICCLLLFIKHRPNSMVGDTGYHVHHVRTPFSTIFMRKVYVSKKLNYFFLECVLRDRKLFNMFSMLLFKILNPKFDYSVRKT